MRFFKKNVKSIVGIVIGMLLASGISVYATYNYFASDVSYTRNGTKMSVEDALNDLYSSKKETSDETKQITANGEQILDKYYKNLNVNVTTDKVYTQAQYDQYGTAQYSSGQTAGIAAAKGTKYNYGNGKSTASGVFSFDMGFSEPSQFWIYIDYGTNRVYNLYEKTSNGYTRYMFGSNGQATTTTGVAIVGSFSGSVLSYTNSSWPNATFYWGAVK